MKLLCDRYAPKKIDDMILDEKTKNLIKSHIEKNTMVNILLAGSPGIGKSTLAKVLVNELNSNSLYINCGQEGNVETIRTKVKDFCDSIAMNSEVPKIVILDEADSLTGNALETLRNTIDDAQSDTRFILTCNYIGKIIAPIQSRCLVLKLSFKIEDVLKRIIKILENEKIIFNKEIIVEFHKNVILKKFPDIRNILNNLENWIVNGQLENRGISSDSIFEELLKNVKKIIDNNEIREARKYLIENEDKFSKDYEALASRLFDLYENNLDKQLVIADYLYRMSVVLDKEIQFFAMLVAISKL